MKKKLLLLLTTLTVLSSVVIAQPILNSTNYNPVSGELITVQPYSFIDAGTAGANQTWDFTSITKGSTAPVTYKFEPVTSTNAATFPNATQQFSSSSLAGFNKVSASAIQNYGIQAGPTNIVYSDPEDQIRYPFTMGTTYTDPWVASFTSGGYKYLRYGTTKQTGDAYGTLQLPGQTFTNVLRAHFVQDYKDSTYITGFGSYVIKYYNDEYMWYLPNTHMPVFSSSTLTYVGPSGTQKMTSANKVETIKTGISGEESFIQSMNFYPNPSTNGSINVDLNLNESLHYEIAIYDNLGRDVLKTSTFEGISGYNFKTIDVSKVAKGLYTLVVISDNVKLSNHKIVIQ